MAQNKTILILGLYTPTWRSALPGWNWYHAEELWDGYQATRPLKTLDSLKAWINLHRPDLLILHHAHKEVIELIEVLSQFEVAEYHLLNHIIVTYNQPPVTPHRRRYRQLGITSILQQNQFYHRLQRASLE